eukprot:scaffold12605_cov114-Isochrysis_galbana.AAC.8
MNVPEQLSHAFTATAKPLGSQPFLRVAVPSARARAIRLHPRLTAIARVGALPLHRHAPKHARQLGHRRLRTARRRRQRRGGARNGAGQ